MAFALKAPKYVRFMLVPIGVVVTAVVNAVVRSVWEDTRAEGGVNLSVWPWALSFSEWLAVYWWAALGWALVIAMVGMFVLAYREERRGLPRRVLSDSYQMLLVFRATGLRVQAGLPEIQAARTGLTRLRGDLINMAPRVFTQATAVDFQAPALLHVGDVTGVQGLPHEEERRLLVAYADDLLARLHRKYMAYRDGV